MNDVFHINDNSLKNQVFYFTGTNAWQIWNKPNNTNFINFFLLGGGAGGQGGAVGIGTTRIGGSGGGSSALTYITVPSFAIPDRLYILVGGGGTGGASGTGAGGAGGLTYICTIPDITSPYNILIKNGSRAAGSIITTTAGLAITASDILLSQSTFISSYNGQTGGLGGAPGTAPNITPNGIPTTPGAGGSGTNIAGNVGTSGSILPILDFPRISGGTSNASTNGTDGNNGYSTRSNFIGPNFKNPMFFTGGAGGGSSNSAVGGKGGDGAYGCGGGGGGAGNVTAGIGGKGGDGLVIITVG